MISKDDISDEINFYNQEADKALKIINENLTVKITLLELQNRLGEKLCYPSSRSHFVTKHALNYYEILSILGNAEWDNSAPLFRVVLKDSILPEGLVISLNEKLIKFKGEIWVIHKNDKDPFPSNPHAHNYQNGLKLHLGNGQLYDSKNNFLNKSIKKGDLILLREKLINFTLPDLKE